MSLEPDTGPDTKDINQFNSLLPQALRLQVSKYLCMSLFPLLNPYFITRKGAYHNIIDETNESPLKESVTSETHFTVVTQESLSYHYAAKRHHSEQRRW
ncbi:hypothetical protein HID58_025702 [Brassica napus]|uniref:Uncharacterized protein n=1 Tax=Brassica napus TaxID=3708 RepID=A0ABQ8CLU2_BRANA|nr:hypothetical protein HID58_025702 [Brassica napus]